MKRRVLTVMLSLAVTVTSVPATAFGSADGFTDGQAAEIVAAPEEIVVEDADEFQAEAPAPEASEVPEEAEEAEVSDGEEIAIDMPEEISLDVPETELTTTEEVPVETAEFGAETEENVPMVMAAKTLNDITVTVEYNGQTHELKDFGNSATASETEVKTTYDPSKGTNQDAIAVESIKYAGVEEPLEINKDYTVTAENCDGAGGYVGDQGPKPQLRIVFQGEYENLGTIIVTFEISPMDITAADIKYPEKPEKGWEYTYDGKEHYPDVTSVVLTWGGQQYTLVEGVDFKKVVDVSGSAVDASSTPKTMKIQGIGNYTNTTTNGVQYTINQADAADGVLCGTSDTLVFYKESNAAGASTLDKDLKGEIEGKIKETVKNKYDVDEATGEAKALNEAENAYDIVYYKTGVLEADKTTTDNGEITEPGLHRYDIKIKDEGTKKNFKTGSFVTGSYMVYDGHSLEYIYSEWKADESETTKTVKENIEAELAKGEKNTYTGENLLGEDATNNTDGIRAVIAGEFVKYADVDKDMVAANLKITAMKDGKDISEVKDAGDYIFRVTGAEETKWADQYVDIPVKVLPKNIWAEGAKLSDISIDGVDQTYYANGKWGEPTIVLKDSKTPLEADKDYKIVGGDYDAAVRGKATKIEIQGIGNYATFNANAAAKPDKVSDDSVVIDIEADAAGKDNRKALVDLTHKSVTARVLPPIKYGTEHDFVPADIEVIQTDPDGVEIVIGPENYTISADGTYDGNKAGKHTVTIKGQGSLTAIPCTNRKAVTYTAEGQKFEEKYEVGTKEIKVTVGDLVDRPDSGVNMKGSGTPEAAENYKVSYYRLEMVEQQDKTEKEARIYIGSTTAAEGTEKSEPIYDPEDEDESEKILWLESTDQVIFDKAGEYYMEIVPDTDKSSMVSYTGMIEGIKFTVSPRSLPELKKVGETAGLKVELTSPISWPGKAVTAEDLTLTLTDKANKILAGETADGHELTKPGEGVENPEYSVAIENGNVIGKTKVLITGQGNYEGTIEAELTINAVELSGGNSEVALKSGGTEIPACDPITNALTSEDVVVKDSNGNVVDPSEYDVICVAVGSTVTAKVTAKADGHYTGILTLGNLTVATTADISNKASFKLDYADPIYYYKADGENAGKQADLTLTDTRTNTVLKGQEGAAAIDPTKDLKPAYDYTITYEGLDKLADSDSAAVTVTLGGVSGYDKAAGEADRKVVGYTGKITQTYLVKKPSLKTVELKAGQEFTYTGKEIVPEIASVTDENGKTVDAKDYVVKGSIDAGEATVVVTPADGSGYLGSASAEFTIAQAVNEIEAVVPQIHVGESRKIEAQAKEGKLTFALKSGTAAAVAADGTVTGKAEGEVVVTVTSETTTNYKGTTKDVTVKVLPAAALLDISGYTVTLKETSYTYDGTEKKPEIVSVASGSAALKAADYEVFYEHNTNAGTAAVKVLGKAPYTGTASATFTIKKAANAVKAEDVQRLFMSRARTFDLKASATYANAPLSYKSDNSKIKVDGKGNVTIAAGYAGSATITVTAAATTNYEAASTTVKVGARPSKTEITRLSQNGTGIRVQYKKNSVGDGFQIQYSKSPEFTDAKNVYVKNISCLTKTVGSKLQPGKWYVRVRVFKFEKGKSGTKLFSPWSDGVKKTMK